MKDRGFTIIELMIVVAILGIMAAIAVPKFVELSACSGGKNSLKCKKFHEEHADGYVAEQVEVNGITYRRVK